MGTDYGEGGSYRLIVIGHREIGSAKSRAARKKTAGQIDRRLIAFQ